MSAPAPVPRWPDVPACHGWLALDRRGAWRLQGERLTHGGLIAFLNTHYQSDDQGAWFVRNGPQQVFVTLHYTPWVLHLDGEDRLLTHTGVAVERVHAAFIDEEGNVVLETEHGPGLVDDRDLPALFAQCRRVDGLAASDADLMRQLEQADAGLSWRGVALQPIRRQEVARHFGFRPDPAP